MPMYKTESSPAEGKALLIPQADECLSRDARLWEPGRLLDHDTASWNEASWIIHFCKSLDRYNASERLRELILKIRAAMKGAKPRSNYTNGLKSPWGGARQKHVPALKFPNNLTLALKNQGDLKEAEQLSRQTRELGQLALGRLQADIQLSMNVFHGRGRKPGQVIADRSDMAAIIEAQ